jgi:hypothetical protein
VRAQGPGAGSGARERTNGISAADRQAANGLGFASLAIGLLEVGFPRQVQWLLGLTPDRRHDAVLRTLGVREMMHGVDLLAHDDPEPGIYARVAGDGLDGALLLAAARQTEHPARFAVTFAMVMGVVAADLFVAARLGSRKPH